jgi:hypothetical protein
VAAVDGGAAVVAGAPPVPLGSSEPPHPPTAAAMSRISSAAPSRRTRSEILDVARRAPAGDSMLPPPFRAPTHPVSFQVEIAAFSSRPCLRSKTLLRDGKTQQRRRTDGRQTPDVGDQSGYPHRQTRDQELVGWSRGHSVAVPATSATAAANAAVNRAGAGEARRMVSSSRAWLDRRPSGLTGGRTARCRAGRRCWGAASGW